MTSRTSLMQTLGCAVAGGGMFVEAYVLFGVGNLKKLFAVAYPDCWGPAATQCSADLLNSISYGEICGVIFGMVVVGAMADSCGRKKASILASVLMLIGLLVLIGSGSATIPSRFVVYTIGLVVFGTGVGEYATASTSAAELGERHYSDPMAFTVARRVVTTFTMQAVGNLVNTAVILALLPASGTPQASLAEAYTTAWVLQYIIVLLVVMALLLYRCCCLKESTIYKQQSTNDNGRLQTAGNYYPLLRYYWPRLIGAGLSWLVWDITFYGNKLFQGTFIQIIEPNADLAGVLRWTLVNSAVALLGLIVASLVIDRVGAFTMQLVGFAIVGLLFAICAAAYDSLRLPENIHLFQVLYYLSTFFGQLGPNATTWLVPSASFPTAVRATAMGMSAAMGKVGALIAGISFAYLSNQQKFTVSAVCGLAGLVITGLFVPRMADLSLSELDVQWRRLQNGDIYDGSAIAAKNLSVVERLLERGEAQREALLL